MFALKRWHAPIHVKISPDRRLFTALQTRRNEISSISCLPESQLVRYGCVTYKIAIASECQSNEEVRIHIRVLDPILRQWVAKSPRLLLSYYGPGLKICHDNVENSSSMKLFAMIVKRGKSWEEKFLAQLLPSWSRIPQSFTFTLPLEKNGIPQREACMAAALLAANVSALPVFNKLRKFVSSKLSPGKFVANENEEVILSNFDLPTCFSLTLRERFRDPYAFRLGSVLIANIIERQKAQAENSSERRPIVLSETPSQCDGYEEHVLNITFEIESSALRDDNQILEVSKIVMGIRPMLDSVTSSIRVWSRSNIVSLADHLTN